MTVRGMGAEPVTVVVGAGVVGMMTAYALGRRGLRVTVIDRLPGPAQLCSRTNAGIMAVGHANAWAGPKAMMTMPRAFAGRDPSVRITKFLDTVLWRWGLDFLRHCTASAHRANTAKLQRLSNYSRNLLAGAEAAMKLPRDTRHDGALYLFQDMAQFAAHAASLQKHGGSGQLMLTRDELVAREPALVKMSEKLVGGIMSHADSVGDCHLFTSRTGEYLTKTGLVDFRYGTSVTGFGLTGLGQKGRIEKVLTDKGVLSCSQVVLATGVETPKLSRPLGFTPRIYPVKGYSGTWRVLDPSGVPSLPFVDETELLAVAVYGGQLRVTAIAEFAGYSDSIPEDRNALLDAYVRRCFGNAVDLNTAQFWTGLRPTTPAGPPYLGRVRSADNLWVNAGHGQLGWTMSLGCGELVAQSIANEPLALTGVSSDARWLESI